MRVPALDLDNLLAKLAQLFEGGHGGDAEDQQEAVGVAHVELAHGGELFGAGRVHDLEHDLAAIDIDLLAVGVFDRWVIAFYEDALDELGCQTALTHASRPDDRYVVFSLVPSPRHDTSVHTRATSTRIKRMSALWQTDFRSLFLFTSTEKLRTLVVNQS